MEESGSHNPPPPAPLPVSPGYPPLQPGLARWMVVTLWVAGGLTVLCLCGFVLVPVIGIMIAIAVPNFLAADVQSKTNRTRTGLRVLAVALEAYRADHGAYPPSTTVGSESVMSPTAPILGNFSSFRAAPITITTPVAYATSYGTDPFSPYESVTYFYTTDGTWFLLWGTGPDRDYDISPAIPPFNSSNVPVEIVNWTYDPTNGFVSDGDIWRVCH